MKTRNLTLARRCRARKGIGRFLAASIQRQRRASLPLLPTTMNYTSTRFVATLQALATAGTRQEMNTIKIELADLFLEIIGFNDNALLPKPSLKRMEKPSIEEIRIFCAAKGIPPGDADWFFHKMTGCGWTNGGKPVKSWTGTLMAWKLGNYLPSLKARTGIHLGGAACGPNEIQRELHKLHNQIRKGDSV